MSSRKVLLLGVLILVTIGILLQVVNAADDQPSGVRDITKGASTYFNGSNYNPGSVYAEAGNITEITIDGIGGTKFWQGYYGEITGEIVLEDANGNRMYNWSDAEPQGEIYASRAGAISWANVSCLDNSDDVTWASENVFYDMTNPDSDNMNETFVYDDHPTIYFGDRAVTGCNNTWLFVSDAAQTTRFVEIALEDEETADTSIFGTIIENRDNGAQSDVTGFDGSTHDFQLMVPENGTANNVETTQYYFWVRLY
ncbi:MAG: hypothetical protein ABIC91_02590 [Nanoarchaeota archaeon]|nr:hypothetical protein [Nanoarchaeota archaeon]MBU1031084.1 hypothetical protein [Nanoarchaeota archaeon]MBU1849502.1 hypothetical protein [Nanoarchaeota archaeon]